MNAKVLKKPETLEEYKDNLSKLALSAVKRINQQKTEVLKNIGHSLVGCHDIQPYQYVGQLFELKQYLKEIERQIEAQYSYALSWLDDEKEREVILEEKGAEIKALAEYEAKTVELKRSISSLVGACK